MYFLKRALQILPVLLIVSVIGFVLIRAMPGGPFDSERKPSSAEIERNLKAKFHLDEPTWKQYLRYLGFAGDAYISVQAGANAPSAAPLAENSFLRGADADGQVSDEAKKAILTAAQPVLAGAPPVGMKRVFAAFPGVHKLRELAPLMLEDERVGYVETFVAHGGLTNGAAVICLTLPEKVREDFTGKLQWKRSGLIKGDLGPSLKYRNHTVNDIIKQCLPVSMTLGTMAFAFAMFTGIPLGCYMALRRGEWGDYLGGFIAMLSFCIPSIVIAPLAILWLAVKLQWLPVALWGSPAQMILPTMVLGLYFSGRVARLMREGLSTTLHSEFITTARAKGVSESAILWKHAFRLAVLPVVSYSGPLLADLLTGSFVVENIFQIPGIGVFFINSIFNRDHTMTVGLVLLYAFLLLSLNMLVDLSYSLLDRRVKYE